MFEFVRKALRAGKASLRRRTAEKDESGQAAGDEGPAPEPQGCTPGAKRHAPRKPNSTTGFTKGYSKPAKNRY